MPFAFHASAPPGEWINDPNGLVYADGAYRLFVQHSNASPDFREIGWARFSSSDLLHWEWDGPAIPPDPTGYAYSGSVVVTGEGALEAFYTRHDPEGGPLQTQRRALGAETGLRWREMAQAIGPKGRNMRDPFLFWNTATADWRMLVAAPCDWTEWESDQSSRIVVWRSSDRDRWTECGAIGPWSPRGVMWEVPVLLDFGDQQALILSIIDKRSGIADCSVRYWLGRFTGADFLPSPEFPAEGLPMDLGSDFYAAIPNVEAGWPDESRILIGWASNWDTARKIAWPEGANGGPISMPRDLVLDRQRQRLRLQPAAQAMRLGAQTIETDGSGPFRLEILRDSQAITIEGDPALGTLSVERRGAKELEWRRDHGNILRIAHERRFSLFADGPLMEIFLEPEGLFMTVACPGQSVPQMKL